MNTSHLRPVTVTDEYLAAIHREMQVQSAALGAIDAHLVDILTALAPPLAPAPDPSLVALVEPAAATVGTPLPDGFPGRAALLAAGYAILEDVAALTDAQLGAISGIGKTTIVNIRAYLET